MFLICSICPEYVHPILRCTVSNMLFRHLFVELKGEVSFEDSDVSRLPMIQVSRVVVIGERNFEWMGGVEGSKSHSRPYIMGILNVTPNSFSDGGKYSGSLDESVNRVFELVDFGADIVDIGGMATNPGAVPVCIEEEIDRVIPVVKEVRRRERKLGLSGRIVISVDTCRPDVALLAIHAGADLINDVSGGHGLEDDYPGSGISMLQVVSRENIPIVLMHMKGTPKTMMSLTDTYKSENVLLEVGLELGDGISKDMYRWNVVVDPGIGFAKDTWQDVSILGTWNDSRVFPFSEFPCMLGYSRKKFIGKILEDSKENRFLGTLAVSAMLGRVGRQRTFMIRAHDVYEIRQVLEMAWVLGKQTLV